MCIRDSDNHIRIVRHRKRIVRRLADMPCHCTARGETYP
jgi:hypothetical protein